MPHGPELELGPKPESEPCILEVDALPILLITPILEIKGDIIIVTIYIYI